MDLCKFLRKYSLLIFLSLILFIYCVYIIILYFIQDIKVSTEIKFADKDIFYINVKCIHPNGCYIGHRRIYSILKPNETKPISFGVNNLLSEINYDNFNGIFAMQCGIQSNNDLTEIKVDGIMRRNPMLTFEVIERQRINNIEYDISKAIPPTYLNSYMMKVTNTSECVVYRNSQERFQYLIFTNKYYSIKEYYEHTIISCLSYIGGFYGILHSIYSTIKFFNKRRKDYNQI